MIKSIKSIKSITVVGGGTSAWLTASYLVSKCSPDVNITVIDKFDGSPVGVGEATLIPFLSFMEKCGFPEKEWFNEIDATIKGGILFENWQIDGENIWHPFSYAKFGSNYDNNLSLWSNTQHLNFVDYGLPDYELYIANKKVNLESVKSIARHIDCGKLVKFIKEKLQDKISFINSEVVDVVKNNDGYIASIKLKNNQQIKSDLYIDCTGFKKVLSNDSIKVDLSNRLFCDTAIAGHIPYKDRKIELHPYTASDAVEHGWIWKIPVKSRIGSGLVFNRSITDIETAKDYFVKYWDNRVEKESLKVIDWTPYYSEKFWNANVVNIGLSAGFIEPLESTGLQFIQMGIELLDRVLNSSFYSQDDITLYNNKMTIAYDETVDYVSMHYFNTNKEGKFWDFVREKTKNLNERTNFYLELMKTNNIHINISSGETIFGKYNWMLWLVQLGYPIGKFTTSFNDFELNHELNKYYDFNYELAMSSMDADTFCDLYGG
jgi:tryptophan halogenase